MVLGGRQSILSLAIVAVLLAPTVVIVAAPAPPDARPKLLGGEIFVYPMDATDHNKPSSGKTQDVSGNARHATLSGVVQVTGMHGEAYRFDSSGDYIALPDSATSGQPDGTFMLWVNRDAAGGTLILKVLPGSTTEFAAGVDSGGHLGFRTAQDQGSPTLSSTTTVAEGVWTHVAFTWGPEGKRIYVDGRLDASDSHAAGIGSRSSATYLGNDPNAPRSAYRGAMDDVRFYDRALSAQEIADVRLLPYGTTVPTETRDRDGDGLDDAVEAQAGTDAARADTDSDDLSDHQELVIYGTDPLAADTDGDTLADGHETFVTGSSPTTTDTDGDGLRDDVDATPNRESMPPEFPSIEAHLVLFDDGYIDLVVDDAGAQATPPEASVRPPYVCIRVCTDPGEFRIYDPEVTPGEASVESADVVGIVLSGNLSVETDDGPVEDPLHFSLFARRGEGSAWTARYAIPPGITRVTREALTLLVVDAAGNHWSASQTFTRTLEGNEWSETHNATADARGWAFALDHTADVTMETAGGRFAAYRLVADPTSALDPWTTATPPYTFESAPPQTLVIMSGKEWNFRTINMNPKESPVQTAFVTYTNAMATPEGQAFTQAASVTAIGSGLDCLELLDPAGAPEGFDALVALAGCADVIATVAPPSPAKLAARGAGVVIREGAKLLRAADAPAAHSLTKMQFVCAKRADSCANMRHAGVLVLNQPQRARTLNLMDRSVGTIDAYDYAKSELRLTMADEGVRDLLLTRSEADAIGTLRSMYRPTSLGTSEQTAQRVFEMHKRYDDHPLINDREAGGFLDDIVTNLGFGGDASAGNVLGWIEDAESLADSVRNDAPRGYVYQASVYADLVAAGELARLNKAETYTSLDGTRTFVVQSARASPQGAIVMETKSGPYTNGDFERMYDAADFVELGGPSRGYAKVLEFRTETGYTPRFQEEAAIVAQAFHIRIVLYDAAGAVVGDYS